MEAGSFIATDNRSWLTGDPSSAARLVGILGLRSPHHNLRRQSISRIPVATGCRYDVQSHEADAAGRSVALRPLVSSWTPTRVASSAHDNCDRLCILRR